MFLSNKISQGFEPIFTIKSHSEVYLDNFKICLITVLKATHSLRLCSLSNTE